MKYEDFEKLYNTNPFMQNIARLLPKNEQCFMCGFKPKNGMIEKKGRTPIDPSSENAIYNIFAMDFLVHMKTTHALDPEIFDSLLRTKIAV